MYYVSDLTVSLVQVCSLYIAVLLTVSVVLVGSLYYVSDLTVSLVQVDSPYFASVLAVSVV